MPPQPRTLVVTPVYCTRENQRLPLLLQCLYWVQHQTDRDFMHVVVDDGSTDSAGEILERIAAQNERLLVYHQSNKGSSAAVNFGVEQALKQYDATYITVTHSDDVLPPRSIEQRLALAKNSTAFVYTDMAMTDFREQHAVGLRAPLFENPRELHQHLLRRGIPYPTMLWRRKIFTEEIGGYDPEITTGEDWEIALRTAASLERKGLPFAASHDCTAVYRIHGKNICLHDAADGTRWGCHCKILKKHHHGKEYAIGLARSLLSVTHALLPYHVRKALRPLKHALFSPSLVSLDASLSAFIVRIPEIDYGQELSSMPCDFSHRPTFV